MRTVLPKLRMRVAGCAAGALLAACATAPAPVASRTEGLAARVDALLARRGLGPDGLAVIDNVVRYEPLPVPPAAPRLVRELLAQPLAAANAETLFYRAVPGALQGLVEGLSTPAPPDPDAVPAPLRPLLDVYLRDLAEAQGVLKSALRGAPFDAPALIGQLRGQLPSANRLGDVSAALDRAAVDRATVLLLDATGRFVRALRASQKRLQFPAEAVRFDSAIGAVVIGTRGDDVYGPDAAVIVDPAGNDAYERAPATGGAVSVIVDLEGDDRYRGSDLVVHGLSALVDFSGNDTYAMDGPGLGAAIAGASVLVDLSGDDAYAAGLFGEGAAAYGLGAVIDFRGDDTYRLRTGGQGYGLAGGVGLLWDRAGDDVYVAGGLADPYNRGGGLSFAQGAASGFRTMLGGGFGILRDDAGRDAYEAELYAQGAGYYYGVGLLWDGAGADRYRAVRYAQGAGVHEAIGVLRDEAGDDRYELAYGVGQGMGLDLAVGVLFDGAGDDRYRAPLLAQGAATANGVGLLSDGGGADRWEVDEDALAWGGSERLRGLPSVGLLLYDPGRAAFAVSGRGVPPPSGGPRDAEPAARKAPAQPRCPASADADQLAGELPTLAAALRWLAPGFAGGALDSVAYEGVRRRLVADLARAVSELPTDDFDLVWSFGHALVCALVGAPSADADALWRGIERVMKTDSGTPVAGAFVAALSERPAPEPRLGRILDRFDRHPACGVRAAALRLRGATAGNDEARARAAVAAQAALASPCWRLKAAAVAVLRDLGAVPAGGAELPSFLRGAEGKAAPAGN